MGLWMSTLYDIFQSFGKISGRILMLGLDNAGKTTMLYKLKLNENVTTIPTIGFNVETVEPIAGVSFTIWDIGGQDKIRPLWRSYFHSTEGLVYVVDSTDRERLGESAEELHKLLSEDSMRRVPVVVMANKQDLPMAMNPAELIDVLGLRKLPNQWHIQGTCATSGEGICESMDALSRMVREFKKNNQRHV